MALFRIEVDSFLQLGKPERDALKAIASSAERTAIALEAVVAKLNEPEPDDPQPAIDALVAKLAASNTALADEVAKILTPQGA